MTDISEVARQLISEDPALAFEVYSRVRETVGGEPVQFSLTRQQQATLDFIADYMSENSGLAPTYAEIAYGIGLGRNTKGRVSEIISALVERGHIRRLPNRARSISIIHNTPFSVGAHLGAAGASG